MPEHPPVDRSRWASWSLRVKIVALGLMLGMVARWANQAWQAYAGPVKKGDSVSAPGPAAQPSPRRTEEKE